MSFHENLIIYLIQHYNSYVMNGDVVSSQKKITTKTTNSKLKRTFPGNDEIEEAIKHSQHCVREEKDARSTSFKLLLTE